MGDQAILHGLLPCLDEAFPRHELSILTSEPGAYKKSINAEIDYNLYMWGVFENKNFFIRVFRITTILFLYFTNRLGISFFQNCKIQKLINKYKEADLIVFAGGGYMRSGKGITQSLNLAMHLLMFLFARVSKAKTIVAPISFGPFSYKWQEKLSAQVLGKVGLVFVREGISKKTLEHYSGVRVMQSTDTAFYLTPTEKNNNKVSKHIIGFTIRQLSKNKPEAELEQAYIFSLAKFAKTYNMGIQPIIQVDALNFGETDQSVTNRVVQELRLQGVNVLETQYFFNVSEGLGIYGKLRILLGMRMHSNIYAYVQNVPFVAVSYEHKTLGICRDLGLEKFCIPWQSASGEKLFSLLSEIQDNNVNIEARKEALKKINSFKKEFITRINEYYYSN